MEFLRERLAIERLFFRPSGACSVFLSLTHGLRRGLHSFAASRLGAVACYGCRKTGRAQAGLGLGEIGWRDGRVQKGSDCQCPKALDVRFEDGLKFGGNGFEVSSLRCYRAGAKGLDVLLGGHRNRLV